MATIYVNHIGEIETPEASKVIIETPVKVVEVTEEPKFEAPIETKPEPVEVILPEIETLPATFEIPVIQVKSEVVEAPIEPEFEEITDLQIEPIVQIKRTRGSKKTNS